jgi:flagellar hook protein FlgE
MSFDIALSGIQAINEQLDTISNNVANSGTYGFKSGTSNFAALYAGNQVNGTEIESTTQSMSLAGGLLNTGDGLNASINGTGFFVSTDSSGQTTYSRVGLFTVDKTGQVVDANGNKVQGYGVVKNTDGTTTQGALGDLVIPTGQVPAVATTTLNYVGNLSADWTVPVDAATFSRTDAQSYNMSQTSVIYDSQGVSHTLTQYFSKDATNNTVDVNYYLGNTPVGTAKLAFNTDGSLTPTAGSTTTADTTLTLAADDVTLPSSVDPITLNINYNGTTQFAGTATASTNQADGNAAGNYVSVALGSDGSMIATYSNGQTQTVGTVALATFANQNGLTPISGTSWVATAASGTANISAPGIGQAGDLTVQSLEQSNVDITTQLVDLMTAQRNYQANSKVITTYDTTLQALMQAIQ